jgi:ABC-type polysaccharide/polyol phosphate transport system ATPase subunit
LTEPLHPAISLQGVSKSFRIYHRRHTTLKETILRRRRGVYELRPVLNKVTLEVPVGQSLGIVGRNGAGKSTLLKLISGLMPPDAGVLTVWGRISTLLELGAGFQGEYTGRENVYLYAALMGIGHRFVDERYEDIVEFSGIGAYIDNPVKTYSSGMYMRLAFAVAVHVDPEVLIVDEVLGVGDEAFQRKCFDRTMDLRARGKTICLVTHDMGAIEKFCDRAIWLEGGEIRADGHPREVGKEYFASVGPRGPRVGLLSRVELEGVEVQPAQARPDAVPAGEGVTVAFSARATDVETAARLNVRCNDSNGNCLLATAARDGDPVLIPLEAMRFRCTFESLPLAPGEYSIEVTATEPESETIMSLGHPPVALAVVGEPLDALLTIPARWEEPAVSAGSPSMGINL